jgi:hypothetical protein
MWCTASFLHAADRHVHKIGNRWESTRKSSTELPKPPFSFVPARVDIDEKGLSTVDFDTNRPNMQVFRMTDREAYVQAMTDCLQQLLRDFPIAKVNLKP